LDRASDAEIIREVLAGGRQRYSVLVERHGPALLAWLARRAGPEEAAELLQETLVRAYERLGELREATRLRSWMLSIAQNLAAQGRRRPAPLPLEAAGDSPGAPAASAALEAGEERARIERACARLPERQREVFEMRVLANLAHAEIAALLGIREDASRASYYQALRKLRAELEDEA